ncbi:hypothetical protein O166_09875 [Pseudogulbenkiania ferrooxidans EGD-HP2]|uniref:Uncharacterized protein n=1 Tax=Pseudogulbenkiania ferrooxidans EGD-HP2 TaxID=1388764 RepID=A0ABP2XKI3_9NEIS|nr:hypothetical protein O166_09875 [Pseudogulbenkiania ferrooxidans EGD-HP2]
MKTSRISPKIFTRKMFRFMKRWQIRHADSIK